MSFSATASGSPAAVKDEIRRQCDGYGTGVSRDEFEAAIPAINAEIDRLASGVGDAESLITVEASGHATLDYKGTGEPQEKTYEQVSIKVTAKRA